MEKLNLMINEKILHISVDYIPKIETNWIEFISALLVPLLAVIGVYIAYQQYKINEQRLRHETYERRLAVYKVVQRYLSEILRDGNTTYDRAMQFNSDASEAAFLFDKSVQDKIDEIYIKSIDMISYHKQMYPSNGSSGLQVGEERSRVVNENAKLLKWHLKQLKESRPFFEKKLGLKVK